MQLCVKGVLLKQLEIRYITVFTIIAQVSMKLSSCCFPSILNKYTFGC